MSIHKAKAVQNWFDSGANDLMEIDTSSVNLEVFMGLRVGDANGGGPPEPTGNILLEDGTDMLLEDATNAELEG